MRRTVPRQPLSRAGLALAIIDIEAMLEARRACRRRGVVAQGRAAGVDRLAEHGLDAGDQGLGFAVGLPVSVASVPASRIGEMPARYSASQA